MSSVLPSPEDLLHEIPLYRRLPPEERQRFATVSLVRSYARGETIFSEGDSGVVFFTIVRGRVKVFKSTPAGKDLILEIFGAGDPLGAVAGLRDIRARARISSSDRASGGGESGRCSTRG
jgi:CRP/FNR family transcriptional regulator, dissimilatory nitrate respiration regulator